MLATRNFSGRWRDLEVPSASCRRWGHCRVGYLGALRPGGLGIVGAPVDPVTGGLAQLMQTAPRSGERSKVGKLRAHQEGSEVLSVSHAHSSAGVLRLGQPKGKASRMLGSRSRRD